MNDHIEEPQKQDKLKIQLTAVIEPSEGYNIMDQFPIMIVLLSPDEYMIQQREGLPVRIVIPHKDEYQ